MRTWLIITLLTLVGCTHAPSGVQPVTGFELNRYLGSWYEIARLDHSFERGLEQVSATYRLKADGSVQVINRGYNTANGRWQQAEGTARFVQSPDVGHLKVSFFGPFYGAYVIFELDQEDYQYAFVSGPNRDYLWLLARQPEVSPALLNTFRSRASALGFSTDQLIFVRHSERGSTAP